MDSRARVRPSNPPVEAALLDPGCFRTHPSVQFGADRVPIQAGLALTAITGRREVSPPRMPASGSLSWFGGLPVTSSGASSAWPLGAGGAPLAHVLQVDLAYIADTLDPRLVSLLPIPSLYGVIQIFHDLETYGYRRADLGAWHLRWIPKNSGDFTSLSLSNVPAGLGQDRTRAAVPLKERIVPTIPSSLDFRAQSPREQDRYRHLEVWFDQYASGRDERRRSKVRGSRLRKPETVDPVTRMFGFSSVPSDPETDKVLGEFLPSEGNDPRQLLFDINPSQFGEDYWFHGGRHLEVWIRSSDLLSGNFSNSWCLIRADW